MSARELRFRPSARADLEEIWSWVEQQSGRERADAVIARLVRAAQALTHAPRMGRALTLFGRGARLHVVHPYLVVYRPGRDGITVLRVIHGRRDIKRA